jgi:hypothetical protein
MDGSVRGRQRRWPARRDVIPSRDFWEDPGRFARDQPDVQYRGNLLLDHAELPDLGSPTGRVAEISLVFGRNCGVRSFSNKPKLPRD